MEIQDPATYGTCDHVLIQGHFYHKHQHVFVALTATSLIFSNEVGRAIESFQQQQVYEIQVHENCWKLTFVSPLKIQLISNEPSWMAWDQVLKKLMLKCGFESKFEVLKSLGSGSFGEVFLVRKFQNNWLYAAKIYKKQLQSGAYFDQELILNQIAILRALNHQNIVKLEEVYQDQSRYYLIQQYIEGVTLDQFLQNPCINIDRKYIMKNILAALVETSVKNVVHRDLSMGNILISKHGEVKIIDFGFATYENRLENFLEGVGTPGFIPPQSFSNPNNCILSSKSDIFSAGAIFHCLIFKKNPFSCKHSKQTLMRNIKMEFRIPQKASLLCSQELSLLNRMLDVFISTRVDAITALNSQYFMEGTQIWGIQQRENQLIQKSR